jgi:Mn-containing catalase
MTREITHMRAFTIALETMGKPPFSIGNIAPTAKLVDQFFNDSTGEGDHGEIDTRGPWNEGGKWEFVESPALADANGLEDSDVPSVHAESSEGADEAIQALLIDQLRDILHAEKQLTKALPKMAKAARTTQLRRLLETHLHETENQVERLNQSLELLGSAPKAKPCKGMAGLVDEGEEVMAEGKKKEDAPADLALIGAALRVEHYEIAAYTTIRNLALQLHQPEISRLMTMSLGEEKNAGYLLDQVAQSLMSITRMPASVE